MKIESTIDHPLAYFIWYFDNKIDHDKKEFLSNAINEESGSPIKLEKNNHVIKILNSEGKWEKYSFKSHLKRKLQGEIGKSKKLMDQLMMKSHPNPVFLSNEMFKLSALIDKVFSSGIILKYSFLEDFRKDFKESLSSWSLDNLNITSGLMGQTYFDVKHEVRHSHFDQIFNFYVSLRIIDADYMTSNEFQNIFLEQNIEDIDKPIKFKSNNMIACHAVRVLIPFFQQCTIRKMGESQLFVNKQGKVLEEGDFSTYQNRLEKNRQAYNIELKDKISHFISKLHRDIF